MTRSASGYPAQLSSLHPYLRRRAWLVSSGIAGTIYLITRLPLVMSKWTEGAEDKSGGTRKCIIGENHGFSARSIATFLVFSR